MANILSGHFARCSFFSCAALNTLSEIVASWESEYRYRSMKPSFLNLELPTLMIFWSNTRPIYFSLDSSLLRASRLHLGLSVGEEIPCSSNPAAILPKLSPLR